MKKILAVDDTKNNLRILMELLDETYELLVATSAKRALEILEVEAVDLILLDIVMPDIDGFEFCAMLSANPKTKTLPIIFLSAKSDEESIERAYEIGGSDYITKPFRPRELQAKLKREFKLQEMQKELENMAFKDSLTSLYNRRYFRQKALEIFATAQQEGQMFAIFMIDIDRFKTINDSYGHLIGDKAIIYLAHHLKSLEHHEDTTARFGGEEFAILVLNTSKKELYRHAQNIRQSIESSSFIHFNDAPLYYTISIGVAQFDKHQDNSLDDLINRADQALYHAKEQGRNQVIMA